ncbi:unnamed protein product [Acanthosepion pharaonis]|uniref:Helitron helicase-like domain-containing protein n=1 Tax=Acanthosepion pharaonis TaxID=158019 RepID=A0A812CMN2_ACAPH|nr:unnamed protein product [Sepia pharaonis]
MPPKRRKDFGRRTAAASAARAARASETPEQTSLRLSRMASSSAARLSTESASAASGMSARRGRLSVEERSLQNSQGAVRLARATAASRASEQPQETAHRRFRNALSTASSRALESPAQTTVRRIINARSTASARALESPAQTTVRCVRNASSTASASFAENSEVRRQRLEKISSFRASLNAVTSPSALFWSNTAYSYDCTVNYPARRDVQLGAMDKDFTFGNAKKWAGEQPGPCCSGGKIKLPSLDEPPQPLRDLLLGTTSESTHFLEAIRKYNYSFQMASFGGKAISEGRSMPTFKVQGQVYHLMGSLLADQGEPPQFLQIYFLADYNEQRLVILHSDFSVGPHRRSHGEHELRFNAPACNEAAAVIHGEEHNSRDIVIKYRGGGLRRISETHRSYDCLQCPLLFPYGSNGYHFKILICQASSDSMSTLKTVSCRSYYAYMFMFREGEFNHLHRCRKLFLQFAVNMAAKMESERLGFIKLNQSKLRTDSYIHLRDGLRFDGDPRNLGKPCIWPSSYTGGPRYMHERTQDAMNYVRHYGRPYLFVTLTCKPKWVEITRELFPGQQYSHRPDLIARVFRLQLCKLMDLILKWQIFGRIKCHMYTVEWQKRSLPHVHILLWVNDKVDANKIDDFISAEISDSVLVTLLHEIILKNMIHAPCGANYEKRLCWSSGPTCAKGYPRNFISETQTATDGYPLYRRRSPAEGDRTVTDNGHTLENIWVVPYCPMLSKTFGAHINVEYCHSVKSIKYICKYVNKGSDAAIFGIRRDNCVDEIAGPKSFTDIRTVKGIECHSYRVSCFRLGLVEDDSQWDAAMAEAEILRTPSNASNAIRHFAFAVRTKRSSVALAKVQRIHVRGCAVLRSA